MNQDLRQDLKPATSRNAGEGGAEPAAPACDSELSRREFLAAGVQGLLGCAAAGAAGWAVLNLAGCHASERGPGGVPGGPGAMRPGGAGAMSGVQLASAKEGPAGTFTVAGAAKLAKGRALVFQTATQIPVVVFKNAAGKVVALSGKCTHAGCTVDWQPVGAARFNCPCHHSRFAENGDVLGGPAQRPLPAYSVRLQGDAAVIVVA